jgi:hypothetical protein
VDKFATFKAVLSSGCLVTRHHDIADHTGFITRYGAVEPVLIFEQSELVCWIRMEGEIAIWRYGNMLTGTLSTPRSLGNPLADDSSAVLDAIDAAWSEVEPEWPPEGTDGEPERFVASVEAGLTPARWSMAIDAEPEEGAVHAQETVKVPGSYRSPPPLPAPASPPLPADSPYATEYNPYRHDRKRYPAAPGYSEQQLDGRILETVHPGAVPAVVGGVALFLAVMPMPYEFYILLHWVVPAMAIWMGTLASRHKMTKLFITFALVAVLYNPIFPFEFHRGLWTVFNFSGAALFGVAGGNYLLASKPALKMVRTELV